MANTRTVSRREQIRDVVGLLARLTLAGVFLVSGAIKASDARETVVAVRAYQLLPESMVSTVAAVMPYLELALGLLLLVGLATRLTATIGAVVLVMFIAAVISAAARGLSIDCGCFGGGGQVDPGDTAYAEEILRDLLFLALAGYLVIRPDTPLSIDRLAHRRAGDAA
ncbi:MAG TPA: MauE/DoxX family redox-associated membrane protein [Nakamurella sp.]